MKQMDTNVLPQSVCMSPMACVTTPLADCAGEYTVNNERYHFPPTLPPSPQANKKGKPDCWKLKILVSLPGLESSEKNGATVGQ